MNGNAEISSGPSERTPRKKRHVFRTIGLVLLSLLLLLVVTGLVLYNFGSMEPPSAEMRARYAELRAAGQAPAIPAAGFHVPIPGCKCHSDDPVLTMQHEGRRITECSGCHGGAQARSAAQ